MIRSPAAEHGVFFQHAQPRHGLARIQHARAGALDGVHVLPRPRRDAAQVLHQVQNHALATEQRAGVVTDDSQHLALMHAHAVEDLRMADDLEACLRRSAPVEPRKNLQNARHRAQAANRHLLARQNRAGGAQTGIDGEVGRGVAGGLIFHQGLLQQCIDMAVLPVHGSFLRGQACT